MSGERPVLRLGWCLVAALAAGCAAPTPSGSDDAAAAEPPQGPRIRVLGTAQDGGMPHAACDCSRCRAAERNPDLRRRIASVALVLPSAGQVFLVDATPDIREQLVMLRDARGHADPGVDRTPVDGVLLTHAHLGHYTGLGFLGFEAIHARQTPVYCSASMASFLRENAPWSGLVERGNISIREIRAGERFDLGEVSVEPIAVPHRHEYTDTLGFLFDGPRFELLYVPDLDSWDGWSRPAPAVFDGLDYALVDGTFYSTAELPGRDVSSIGHPPIVNSMDVLDRIVAGRSTLTYFTHLNHSNPANDAGAPERAEIERRGFRVAKDGLELPL